jgi:hypothetical protein
MFGVLAAKTNVAVAAVAWRPAQLYTSHTMGPLLACCEPPGIYDWRHNNIHSIHQYCVPCIYTPGPFW